MLRRPREEMVEQTVEVAVARRHIIERPRLTRLLDEATARIILLVAPAGYGKTTLARQWLEARPHSWYRSSPASEDVAALSVGLADAIASIIPGAGQRMRKRLRVTDAPERDFDVLAELLTEDLNGWPPDAWLAIDDYQFAMGASATEQFVAMLVESAPLRLLVMSRRRPSWATARQLLYGEFLEVGRSLLTMNQEEAMAVLAGRPRAETPGLCTLADGWPAILGLAALNNDLELRDRDLPSELYDFFAEELFQGLTAELQQKLCELTLASGITHELGSVLFGEDALRVIEEGVRLGVLTPQADDTYDLHPLLRDFLERKLQSLDPAETADNLGRLVRHLIARNRWDDAFELIQRPFAANLLIELVESGMSALLANGRLPTLARWLGFGYDCGLTSPVLHLAEAEIAFREGVHRKAGTLALEAAREFGEGHALTCRALSLAAESAYQQDDSEASLALHQRALSLARSEEDAKRAAWGQFLTAIQLESDAAEEYLRDVARTHGANVDGALRLATARLLLSATRDGTVAVANSMWPALYLVERTQDAKIRTSFLYLFGSILAATGHYVEALEMVERVKADAQTYRLAFTLPFSLLVETTACIGLREFSQAAVAIDQCSHLATRNADVFLEMSTRAAKCKMLIAHSAFEDAAAVVRYDWPRVPGPVLFGELLGIQALTMACMGDFEGAMRNANLAEETTRGVEARTLAACTRAIVALEGREPGARSVVFGAFDTAELTGNFDSFVVSVRARPRLLKFLAQEEQYRATLAGVLARSRDEKLARRAGVPVLRQSPRRDAVLSPREEEVFTLVRQGCTNREIAEALVLSEATVKVHVRHILQKLGVRSRMEAVLKGLP